MQSTLPFVTNLLSQSRRVVLAFGSQAGRPILYPKEHGAYAMLAIPLIAAMLTTGFTVNGIFIAVATITGFLAHEPLLILCGHRGNHARRVAPQATTHLIILSVLTCFFGLAALLMGTVSSRWVLIVCFSFAATSYAMSVAGWHRRTGVHLWGILGLSMPCVPILMAGDASLPHALTFWAVWLVGFAATTLGVRGMMSNQKHKSRRLHILMLSGLTLLIAMGAMNNTTWTLVTLPMVAYSWYLLIAPPPLKKIRQSGWMMVIAAMSTALMTILLFQ